MGHVKDLWTKPGPAGRRVKSARHGSGKRWLARWIDPTGREDSQAFTSKDAALAHVARMEVAVRDGSYIDPDRGRRTFEDYAREWLKNQLQHRASSAEQAESRLRLYAFPEIGGMPIGAVRRADIQRLVNRAAEFQAPSTVEVTYGYVATVFRSAVLDRVLAHSPCVKINLPAVQRVRVVPLVVPQVGGIHAAMPARYRAAVILAAASGLRQGELFGLSVDRLEGPRDGVTLVVDRQRGRRLGSWDPLKSDASERRVAIGEVASRVLWEHLDTHGAGVRGHVFSTSSGTEVMRPRAGDLWRSAIAGMGLKERSGWHELRHHHASLLIAAGLSVPAVADRLGHADQGETLRTYSHLWPPDEDRAVAAVDAALGPALTEQGRNVAVFPQVRAL